MYMYVCVLIYYILYVCIVEGKDTLIISEDQDRFVVVAGTFRKLVEQLACEEKPGTSKLLQLCIYINVFIGFMCYEYISHSIQIKDMLVLFFLVIDTLGPQLI